MMENASILETLPVEELQYSNLIIVADMQSPQAEIDVYLCKRADYDEEYGEVTDYVGRITLSNIGKRTHQVSSSGIDSMFRGLGLAVRSVDHMNLAVIIIFHIVGSVGFLEVFFLLFLVVISF